MMDLLVSGCPSTPAAGPSLLGLPAPQPRPSELWLALAGSERQVVLVLGEPEAGPEEAPGAWQEVVLVSEDVSWQTALELTIAPSESTLARPLLVEWRSQGPLPQVALAWPIGRLERRGWQLVANALKGVWDESRFGLELSGRDDPRLAGLERRERDARRLWQAAWELLLASGPAGLGDAG